MFKDKLRELRKSRNISQEKLANDIYVSRSAVAKWEQGRGVPSKESLELICKYFEIDENELLDKKETIELCNKLHDKINRKEKIQNILLILLAGMIIVLLIVQGIDKNTQYIITNVISNYELKSVGVRLDEEYHLDVNYIMRNTGFYYDEYLIEETDNYIYNYKTETLIPKKTGNYYVGIELIDNKRKKIVHTSIIRIFCYDINQMTEINNVDDLYKINNNPDGHYILNNNIDLMKENSFEPLCKIAEQKSFTGVLINPYNYVIKNLNINSSLENDQDNRKHVSAGLFNSLSNAYIDNIIIENIDINLSDNDNIIATVGGLSAYCSESLITNCKITGKLSSNNYIGGIFGTCDFSSVKNCIFNGNITQINNINKIGYAGGLFGSLMLNLSEEENRFIVENNIVNANIISDGDCGEIAGKIRGDGCRNNVLNCIINE